MKTLEGAWEPDPSNTEAQIAIASLELELFLANQQRLAELAKMRRLNPEEAQALGYFALLRQA